MFVKLVGSAVLMLSAAFFGIEKSRRYKEKYLLLVSLAEFISYIADRIEGFREPLCDIYAMYKNTYLSNIGFTDNLRENGMNKSINEVMKSLNDDIKTTLFSFSEKLGTGDAQAEVSLCRYTANRLKNESDKMKETLTEKVRMLRTLPILVISVLIILII